MIVKIKKLHENAVIPFQKHINEDACFDLVPVDYKYNPKYDRFEYKLGFATEFSPDWEAEIRPRSTNTKTEAYIPNGPGTIDACYRGEWNVFFKLRTSFDQIFPDAEDEDLDLCYLEMENEYAPYKLNKEAIAQVKFNRVETTIWKEVDELSDTERGADGGLLRS